MGLFSSNPGAVAESARADETWRMLAGIIEATRVIPPLLRAPAGSLPLTVIGGFLGAGKTTLLNRLLAGSHGVRLAVLVNDFGRINIDARLVASRTADTIDLANGCACCSVAGELTRRLVELAQRPDPPHAIVIETSGTADPRGVAQVALANPALRLDGMVTLVDAETLFEHARHREHGALFAAQVKAADVILLTKTDLVDASWSEAARVWLASHAPGVPIVTAIQGEVPAEIVLGPHGTGDRSGDSFERHEDRFRSWSATARVALDRERFLNMMEDVGARTLRSKGVLWLSDAPGCRTIYQRVGARSSLVPGEPWQANEMRGSSVVVIGPASLALDFTLAPVQTEATPPREG